MELKGIKYIDANDFYSLIIRDTNDGLKVKAKGDINYQTIKSSYPFTKELDRKNEDKAKDDLISYFIRNNKINEIKESVYLPWYDGSFLKVSSLDKDMYLQIKKSDASINTIKKILDKYLLDRHKEVFNEEDVVNYNIYTSNKSSYNTYDINGNKYMNITLKTKPHSLELAKKEEEFFKAFISEKLSLIDDGVSLGRNRIYMTELENFVGSGRTLEHKNLSITLHDDKLVDIIYNLIYNHNIEIRESKKLQLKMKGV